MLVPLVNPAGDAPLSGPSQRWSPQAIHPVLVFFVDSASVSHLCGSSQRVSYLMWIQPVLVPFVDQASAGPLSRSSHQLWFPLWNDPASAIPLVHTANAGTLSGSSQRLSPL